jgi:hypothetical protein
MKSFLYLLLLLVFLSCDKIEENKIKDVDFFSDEISKNLGTRKIIDLEVKFSECGEWGGHDENISIDVRKDGNFYLHYKKYSVDCNKMILVTDIMGTYNSPDKKLNDSITIRMNNTQKKSILNFSQILLGAKFREYFPGHAGNRFNLYKHEGLSGSDFEINFYGYDSILHNSYNKLIKDIKKLN